MDVQRIEKELGFPVEIIKEGSTNVIVPRMSSYLREDGIYEPSYAPVFYNPKAKFNRDIAVFIAKYLKSEIGRLEILEPLAGSGVRSMRYAVEAHADKVVAVDINPLAIKLIRLNAELNGIQDKVVVIEDDANTVLHSRKLRGGYYDLVDIDPFGSPMPFVDGAIRSTRRGGIVAFTATDTAPLTGARTRAALRKYGARTFKTPFGKEVAIRVLIAAIMRIAAVREVGLTPLISFFRDYYVRTELRLDRGARVSDEKLEKIGYLAYNDKDYSVKVIQGYPAPRECVDSGYSLLGPLWLGKLATPNLRDFIDHAPNAEVKEFITNLLIEDEINSPFSYKVERVASILKVHMPSPRLVVIRLRELGYRAVIAHYDKTSVKTDAPRDVVFELIKELSPRP